MEILSVLWDPILPVFAIMVLGFGLGRIGRAQIGDARILNRFAMTILLPAFLFGLISTAPVDQFSPIPVLVYLGAEIVCFSAGFALARWGFRRSAAESLLLGFAGIFANNALYVLPITVLLYGPQNVLPITSIIILDSVVAFGCSIIALDLIRAGKVTARNLANAMLGNPLIASMMAGLVVAFLGLSLPAPLVTFTKVTGAGAAPVALFALGVVLSQTRFRPDGAVIGFTAIKLVVFPVVFWLGLSGLAPDDPDFRKYLLASAGPAGAMSFSLAMLYDIRTETIAQVIVITSVLTLGSLALLA